LEIQQQGPNYYQILDVTRDSNPLEIKRAYKKLGLKLHPDKNPSPDAADEFDRVKQAYDVLMDLELRDVYNKFGKDGVANNKRYSETQFLIEVAIFYVSWAVMVFFLTMGKKSGQARGWTYMGMIVMLVVEVVVMTSQTNHIPTWLLPTVTEYDLVRIMHSLFPAFMNGCRSLGSFLFVDVDSQLRLFLLALQEQNKDILLVLRDVQISVKNIQAHSGGGGSHPTGMSNKSTANIPVTTDSIAPTAGTAPTAKLREFQDRLQYSNPNVAQAVQSLQAENKLSNLGFYGMIMCYIVVSYIFG
jgi:hypothetical protein